MIGWFRKKNLESHLRGTKKIKIHGLPFEIKKVDMLDYLNGSKVMTQIYDVYRQGPEKVTQSNMNAIKDHYRDIFMAGVVKPALYRKPEGSQIGVDELFQDWGMASDLYTAISEFTYGKKKKIANIGSLVKN